LPDDRSRRNVADVKAPLCCLALLSALTGAGCVMAPDAEERAARRESAGYYEVEETRSRLKRKVPMSDVNSATLGGASATDKMGGKNMRDRNTTPPGAVLGP
jgi:hypothetical protein